MMRFVTIERFGVTKTDEGKAVKISITNSNGMKIELLNYGATLKSALVPNRDDSLVDVVLGYDTLSEYEADEYYMGATVGRCAGRIRSGQFALDSKEYVLAVNAPPHHLNGGSKSCLSKKIWNYELLEEGNGVCFSCGSHDGEEGYPGQVQIEVTYVLTNKNEIVIDYKASTDKPTILNITNNAYFNLNGQGSSSFLNHEVQFFTNNYLPNDADSMITGEVCDVAGTRFNFLIPRKLTELTDKNENCLDYDHDFCFDLDESVSAKKFRQVARISNPSNGITLTVSTSQPCVRFYTGGNMKSVFGKNDARYSRFSAFTVQCRGLTNAINEPRFPSVVLRRDQLYQHLTIYRFSLIE